MTPPSHSPARLSRVLGLLVAAAVSVGLALWVIEPAWQDPDHWLIGNWVHPDCLSNHWLLAWVAEQVMSGGSILHNDRYYWPVGDGPLLAGNGSEGFLYLPFHALLGWPRGVPPYVITVLTLNGLAAWSLGRAAGGGPWSSLLPAAVGVVFPFTLQELSAGRFSQVDICWMVFFLAAWLRLLDRPGTGRAVLAGALLAAASFFYWYYGWFCVLAGGIVLLARLLADRKLPPIRPMLVFAVSFLVLIGPWALLFWSAWRGIPGTDEVVEFPHPQAFRDAGWPDLPFSVEPGNRVGQAMAVSAWVAGLAGAVVAVARGTALTRGLLAVWVVFGLLALGPQFSGAPYTLLYGLAAPLRRFWWPLRHYALIIPVWAALGAMGASRLYAALAARLAGRRWPLVALRVAAPLAGLALALSSPVLLGVQGAPVKPVQIAMRTPPEVWPELGTLDDGVLVEPPISPEVAGTQQHLIYQRWHHKTLLSGHALWVDRVRPDEWDAFVAANSFLSAMQALERGELVAEPGTDRALLTFKAADLQSLEDQGVRWFALNRESFTFHFQDLMRSYRVLFDALFGQPVLRAQGLWVWDAQRWEGKSRVSIPAFQWPAGVQDDGPDMPLSGRRPMSRVFGAPNTELDPATRR